jgi:hypothetical protein
MPKSLPYGCHLVFILSSRAALKKFVANFDVFLRNELTKDVSNDACLRSIFIFAMTRLLWLQCGDQVNQAPAI